MTGRHENTECGSHSDEKKKELTSQDVETLKEISEKYRMGKAFGWGFIKGVIWAGSLAGALMAIKIFVTSLR